MSVNGSEKIFGIEATYLSTGVFFTDAKRWVNGERKRANFNVGSCVAVMKIRRLSIDVGKGRAASFREATYYMTRSEKLGRLNEIIGVSEFETDEKGEWTLKIWEWK